MRSRQPRRSDPGTNRITACWESMCQQLWWTCIFQPTMLFWNKLFLGDFGKDAWNNSLSEMWIPGPIPSKKSKRNCDYTCPPAKGTAFAFTPLQTSTNKKSAEDVTGYFRRRGWHERQTRKTNKKALRSDSDSWNVDKGRGIGRKCVCNWFSKHTKHTLTREVGVFAILGYFGRVGRKPKR